MLFTSLFPSSSRFPFAFAATLGLAAIASPALAQCPAAASFAAQSRGCSVRLTWTLAVGALPPTVWEIYRNTTNSLTGALPLGVNTPTDYSFDDTPPLRNTTYYYFVRGLPTVAGLCPQGPQFSPAVSGKLLPVATPEGLTSSVSCSRVTLSWNALPDATNFEILRRGNDGVVVSLANVPGNATSFADTAGVPGERYDYFVRPTLACSTGNTSTTGLTGIVWPSAPAVNATYQPVSAAVNAGQGTVLRFTLISNFSLNANYSMRHDGVNVPLSGWPNSRFALTSIDGFGAGVTITDAKPSDNGVYTFSITNSCGTASQDLILSVRTTCKADFNESGVVNVQDIFDMLSAWFAGCS